MLLKRLKNLIDEGPQALPGQFLWLAPMLVFVKFAANIGRPVALVADEEDAEPPEAPVDVAANQGAEGEQPDPDPDPDAEQQTQLAEAEPGLPEGEGGSEEAPRTKGLPPAEELEGLDSPEPLDQKEVPAQVAELQEIGLLPSDTAAQSAVLLAQSEATGAETTESTVVKVGNINFAAPPSADPGTVSPGIGAAFTPDGSDPADPGPTNPGPTDPAPTDPGPTDPGPTDPGPTDPGPVDPSPPVVGLPDPTDPGPLDPGGDDIIIAPPALEAAEPASLPEISDPTELGQLNFAPADGPEGERIVRLVDDHGGLFNPTVEGDTVTISSTGPVDFDSIEDSAPGVVVGDGFKEVTLEVIPSNESGDGPVQTFSFTLQENQAPTGIELSNDAISESLGAGEKVATLAAVDANSDGNYEFEIIDDPDGKFQLGGTGGNELQLSSDVDSELSETHVVRVRVTDQADETFDQDVVIRVADVNETRPYLDEADGFFLLETENEIGAFGVMDVEDDDITEIATDIRLVDDFDGLFSVTLDENGDAVFSVTQVLDIDDLPPGVFVTPDPGGRISAELQVIVSDEIGDGAIATVYVTPEVPSPWDNVIEDLILDGENLELIGSEWDNTLIRNVTIRNFTGDGIVLEDVDNVLLENVTIENVTGNGVLYENVANVRFDGGSISDAGLGIVVVGALASSVENVAISEIGSYGIVLHNAASTLDFLIEGNTISDVQLSGIVAGQDVLGGIDHQGLEIIGNTISGTGLAMAGPFAHAINVQSQDFLIDGNVILNTNWGDAIAAHSSGTITNNIIHTVNGADSDLGFGISYLSDHAGGSSDLLLIQGNTIFSETVGGALGGDIRIHGFATTEPLGEDGRVHSFVIIDNTLITSADVTGRIGVATDWKNFPPDLDVAPYSVIVGLNEAQENASPSVEALVEETHEFAILDPAGDAALADDFTISNFDQQDIVLLNNAVDFNGDTFINLADIEAETSVVDGGVGNDVTIQFAGGGSLTLAGIGTGGIASINDILSAGYEIGLG